MDHPPPQPALVPPATPTPRAPTDLSLWLVHDWLTGMRGGERVLLELVRLFPQAKIATLFYLPGSIHPDIESRIRRVSFLQDVPEIPKLYRRLLPILPLAIRTLQLDPCDIVISTCHCVAKGVPLPPRLPRSPLHPPTRQLAPHLCYCFSPMRYIWGLQDQYVANDTLTGKIKRQLLDLTARPLRAIDLRFNAGVTAFCANSLNIAARIQRCYHRPAATVYGGIDGAFYQPNGQPPGPRGRAKDFYLVVSALVPYKRIDLAVEAFASAWGQHRRLIIIGKGPQESRLRALARRTGSANIEFRGWQSDESVRWHYQNAQAFIFPGEEDFGLTPLESLACGRPVIAFGKGGVLETLTPATGVLFTQQAAAGPGGLQEAIEQFESRQTTFDPQTLHQHATRFNWTTFRQEMWDLTRQLLLGT